MYFLFSSPSFDKMLKSSSSSMSFEFLKTIDLKQKSVARPDKWWTQFLSFTVWLIGYESYDKTLTSVTNGDSPWDITAQCHLSRLSYHGGLLPRTLLLGILYVELTKGTLSRMQWKARVLPNKKLFFSHACFSQQVSFRSLKLQDVFLMTSFPISDDPSRITGG